MKTDSMSNQLRWVILLLAAAVILPTVCLLWFMNQAVKNERLAVRQRLKEVYIRQLKATMDDGWIQLNLSLPLAQGILIYNDNDKMVFPVLADNDSFIESENLQTGLRLEHGQNAPAEALQIYQDIRQSAHRVSLRFAADIAAARCLNKLDQTEEAIGILQSGIADNPEEGITSRIQKYHAYLLLLKMIAKDDPRFEQTLSTLFDNAIQGLKTDNELQFLGESDFLRHAIPSSLQSFVLSKYIDYTQQLPEDPLREKNIKQAEHIVSLLNRSLQTAWDYPEPSFIKSEEIVLSSLFSLKTQNPLYGRYHRSRGYTRLLVFNRDHWKSVMESVVKEAKQLQAVCSIYDQEGIFVAGTDVRQVKHAIINIQNPFLKMELSESLPGWTAHLYVEDVIFEAIAQRQTATYLWAGGLVVVLILGSGGLMAQVLGRQIRMNRLKNDFIATVTHELKTPLASMRLLVDTLLEGHYEGKQTATEYLQLVANENKRLTHLIDSFLTFSRMERNKQVFDFQLTPPAAIAVAAVEAMGAKFRSTGILPVNHSRSTGLDSVNHGQACPEQSRGDAHDTTNIGETPAPSESMGETPMIPCKFSASIADDLPAVNADKDGMVTVLVNLLENAYKYTNGEKHIELSVYEENGHVCFAVKDNGIGLSPRAQRKIFNRFYQVDSRLSRRAEGCGLGLSIVKFIVDAHKGTIEVESKLNQGSVFTVKLPTVSCRT